MFNDRLGNAEYSRQAVITDRICIYLKPERNSQLNRFNRKDMFPPYYIHVDITKIFNHITVGDSTPKRCNVFSAYLR